MEELVRQTTDRYGPISDKWGGTFDSNTRDCNGIYYRAWVCGKGTLARTSMMAV